MSSDSVLSACPAVWVLSDGTAGMEVQSLGLAEALTDEPRLIRVTPPGLSRHFPRLARFPHWPLPAVLNKALAEYGLPDAVITTGRRHAALSVMMRRRGGGRLKTVHIQNPRLPLSWFDVLVAPSHDAIRGDNVLVTTGSLNRMATLMTEPAPLPPETLKLEPPLIAVMIGGSNRRYRVDAQDYRKFAHHLAAIAGTTGAALLLIPSRRSLAGASEAMAEPLAQTRHWWWRGDAPNPYPGILSKADALIVTADSVNMTSEAATTGKPVYVAELKPESGRVALFQKIMQEGGYTKPVSAITPYNFPAPPEQRLDETTRIAALLRSMFWPPEPQPDTISEKR